MEIATKSKVIDWPIGIDWYGESERSPSESKSLQSHLDRASLFELDADRFSEYLQAIAAPQDLNADIESLQANSSHWRADSAHRVSSNRVSSNRVVASASEFTSIRTEITDSCTELPAAEQGRSMYGACAPLPLRKAIGETREERLTRNDGDSDANRVDCLQASSKDWYDDAGFDRESAARFLQLLEHQQSQWLTVPNNHFLPPLLKLPG